MKPPDVLALAGHGLRWQLLSELAHSDRQVRELTDLVGQPQSLVSYHLGRLRAAGLVAMRRSSADRREAYYRVDLVRCGQLLADAAAALHPGLRPVPPRRAPRVLPAASVLFLCTGNSARSQIAEALLRHHGGDAVEVFSAGSHPKRLHPSAVRVMRERFGIDIAGQQVKHLSEFAGRRFDYVISLCDRLREVCPDFPGPPEMIHWSIPDPAAEGEDTYPAFERTGAELDTRVRFLIHHMSKEDQPCPKI
jgi:protein-tyrosine-phosphatase/DNA-binding transcriptional ArsR family regulator